MSNASAMLAQHAAALDLWLGTGLRASATDVSSPSPTTAGGPLPRGSPPNPNTRSPSLPAYIDTLFHQSLPTGGSAERPREEARPATIGGGQYGGGQYAPARGFGPSASPARGTTDLHNVAAPRPALVARQQGSSTAAADSQQQKKTFKALWAATVQGGPAGGARYRNSSNSNTAAPAAAGGAGGGPLDHSAYARAGAAPHTVQQQQQRQAMLRASAAFYNRDSPVTVSSESDDERGGAGRVASTASAALGANGSNAYNRTATPTHYGQEHPRSSSGSSAQHAAPASVRAVLQQSTAPLAFYAEQRRRSPSQDARGPSPHAPPNEAYGTGPYEGDRDRRYDPSGGRGGAPSETPSVLSETVTPASVAGPPAHSVWGSALALPPPPAEQPSQPQPQPLYHDDYRYYPQSAYDMPPQQAPHPQADPQWNYEGATHDYSDGAHHHPLPAAQAHPQAFYEGGGGAVHTQGDFGREGGYHEYQQVQPSYASYPAQGGQHVEHYAEDQWHERGPGGPQEGVHPPSQHPRSSAFQHEAAPYYYNNGNKAASDHDPFTAAPTGDDYPWTQTQGAAHTAASGPPHHDYHHGYGYAVNTDAYYSEPVPQQDPLRSPPRLYQPNRSTNSNRGTPLPHPPQATPGPAVAAPWDGAHAGPTAAGPPPQRLAWSDEEAQRQAWYAQQAQQVTQQQQQQEAERSAFEALHRVRTYGPSATNPSGSGGNGAPPRGGEEADPDFLAAVDALVTSREHGQRSPSAPVHAPADSALPTPLPWAENGVRTLVGTAAMICDAAAQTTPPPVLRTRSAQVHAAAVSRSASAMPGPSQAAFATQMTPIPPSDMAVQCDPEAPPPVSDRDVQTTPVTPPTIVVVAPPPPPPPSRERVTQTDRTTTHVVSTGHGAMTPSPSSVARPRYDGSAATTSAATATAEAATGPSPSASRQPSNASGMFRPVHSTATNMETHHAPITTTSASAAHKAARLAQLQQRLVALTAEREAALTDLDAARARYEDAAAMRTRAEAMEAANASAHESIVSGLEGELAAEEPPRGAQNHQPRAAGTRGGGEAGRGHLILF